HIPESFLWLDTIEMAKILLPLEASYSLKELAVSIGIDQVSSHRALRDARTTANLFLHLLGKLKNLDLIVFDALNKLSGKAQSPLCDLINQEYSLRLHHFPQEGISARQLFIMPDKANDIFFTSIPGKEKDEAYRITRNEVTALLQPGGNMDSAIPGFQYRREQEEMAQGVAKSFNNSSCLLVEAGTGTGKSLAYLLPGILWSTKSGHRVVISTHTINLQEQLLNKEIPLAKEISGIDFTATVIKGRSHYLCLRKWEHFFTENNGDILPLMMRLVIWVRHTQTGDINEINLSKKEMSLWYNLAAGSETCFGAKCRFFRGLCFISRARKTAEQSNLVIVNHSLLLANAAADDNILPEYKYLVIDEAHQLEKVAEEQFSLAVDYYEILTILHKLRKTGNQGTGLLDSLMAKTGKWTGVDENLITGLIRTLKEAEETVRDCLSTATEFFTVFSDIFAVNMSTIDQYAQTVRILPQHREEDNWSVICAAGENLSIRLSSLIKLLLTLGERSSLVEMEFGMEIGECHEINILTSKLHQVLRGLELVLKGDEEKYVSWVEYNGNNHYPLVHTSPVDVRDQLQEYLFISKTAAVLTSATLTVEDKFDYFIESTGLDLSDFTLHTMQFHSPFIFEEKVIMGIASDLPDPGSASDILFVDRISKALIKLISAAKGRTLVLFTSHHQLKQVYENILQPLKKEGITVYAHGVTGNRSKILEGFKNKEHSVILGANSFWEGIDIVGEALSLVIIVKLPFWPPSMPTVSARLDRFRSLRINGFRRYSLPQAIIRFRQGCGRLIRSQSDYGAICVFDKRIYQKSYGSAFIKSLPKMKTVIGKTDELAELVADWLVTKGENEQSFAFAGNEKVIE
ncbi:MAG: helicase C-terminal domain-containing protein, partial [Dehalobacterium sp.]